MLPIEKERKAILTTHRRFPRVPGTLLTRRVAVGALCVALSGAAALGIQLRPAPADASSTAALTSASGKLDAARADALSRSNRSQQRTAPTPGPAAKKVVKKAKPGPLPHIAGFNATQIKNAWAIVQEGHRMGVNPRGQQIALATAMQESNLLNLKRAVDHDSLGLFQQRPSSGWGSPKELTNPKYAAHAFYSVLVHYKGSWGCLTCAAQKVQRSAYPNAYAKHSGGALRLVRALDKRF